MPKIRYRSLGLSLLAVATVLLIYCDAKSCGVLTPVSNRMRFHAIPVALSQLYHGRAHDYTAFNSIAMPFQSERPLQELLNEYSAPGAPADGTYYWAADDRGLSDYVYAAFALFGPKIASFGKLYLLLLLLSSLLFIVAYWQDATALAVLVFTLCAIDVLTHVLVIAGAASNIDGMLWKEPVGLFESRIFDMLSFVALLHFIFVGIRRRSLRATAWLALILQVFLFVLLYHARSSLGWQVLAVGVVSAAYAARSIMGARPFRFLPAVAAGARPFVPLVILILGLAGLAAYKGQVYNPRYFQEQGQRTFWHNALMGFSHPKIHAKYGTVADDRVIIDLVINRMKRRHDPRLTPAWNTDAALCSLGGHALFDWATYEQAARETYWSIWAEHPWWAFSNYLWCKPVAVTRQVRQITWPSAVSRMDEKADAFRYNPFRPWALAIVLVAVGLVRTNDLRGMLGRYAGALTLIGACSLIPSVAFYPAVPTLMGFLTTLTLGTYLGVAWLVLQFRERVRPWRRERHSRAGRWLEGGQETCPSN